MREEDLSVFVAFRVVSGFITLHPQRCINEQTIFPLSSRFIIVREGILFLGGGEKEKDIRLYPMCWADLLKKLNVTH